MTRSDYLKLAEALRMGKHAVKIVVDSGRKLSQAHAVDMVALHIADKIAEGNPSFDKDLFLRNATVIVPTEH